MELCFRVTCNLIVLRGVAVRSLLLKPCAPQVKMRYGRSRVRNGGVLKSALLIASAVRCFQKATVPCEMKARQAGGF